MLRLALNCMNLNLLNPELIEVPLTQSMLEKEMPLLILFNSHLLLLQTLATTLINTNEAEHNFKPQA